MNVLKKLFKYTPNIEHSFSIQSNTSSNQKESKEEKNSDNIFTAFEVNSETMKKKYNTKINSDIVYRDFTLNARGKQYKAFILYIDGMVDSISINDFVLESLMLRNKANTFDGSHNKVVTEAIANNITVKKIKKFDLVDYIYNCLVPQNSVKKCTTFSEILSGINSGNCALFIDTINTAFDIDVKGFKQRGVEAPTNEVIIKGPQEAFVENIRTNTSLIRRIVNNENLIIENIEVGKISQTKCAVCYMQNITNQNLVNEVKYRLNNLAIDSLLSSGQLEQLIEDDRKSWNTSNFIN
jgi:spore germination protein KA